MPVVCIECLFQRFPDLENCSKLYLCLLCCWYSNMFFITESLNLFGLPTTRSVGKSFLKKTLEFDLL